MSDETARIGASPRQARSRERLAKLLGVAEDLLAEGGLDALGMRELARRSGVPLASVYEYFADRGAIVQALAVRHLKVQGELLSTRLAGLKVEPGDMRAVALVVDQVTDAYAAFQRASPSYAAVWTSAQALGQLAELDRIDTRSNAALIAPLLAQALSMNAADAHHLALTICNGTGATLRYALTLPDAEAAGVIACWKMMLKATCEQAQARRGD